MPSLEEKYKGVPKKVAAVLAAYETEFFREDKPAPFCGMQVYPIAVRDYEKFMDATACLSFDKNTAAAGLSMTNFEYLYSKMMSKEPMAQGSETTVGQLWSYRFYEVLKLCLHLDNGMICPKCGHITPYGSEEFQKLKQKFDAKVVALFVANPEALKSEEVKRKLVTEHAELQHLYCPYCHHDETKNEKGEIIPATDSALIPRITYQKDSKNKLQMTVDGKYVVSSKDFDLFKYMVMFQNISDYRDESWIDPSLRKDHEESMKIRQKQNPVSASLERKVVALSMISNYKISEIYDMPIRKFSMALSLGDDLIEYKINKLAAMVGLVQLPKGKKIEHWLYKEDKDLYGNSYKTLDDFKAVS